MLIIDSGMQGDLQGMIEPYIPNQVRAVDGRRVISYGQSSAGYDIRMASEMKVFTRTGAYGMAVNPKDFDDGVLRDVPISEDKDGGKFFVIPPHGSALTRSVEEFNIPPFVEAICLGKSTYARCGIIVNVTPLEPGWYGYLTIEIANTTPRPVRLYANEGIAQLLFVRLSGIPDTTYADRQGKYQGQGAEIVTARA